MMNQETTEREQMNVDAPGQTSASASPKNKGKGRLTARTKLLLALIPVILIIAGYFIDREYFAFRESTDDAQIDGNINPVAAKVSGHVLAIDVKDNQFVKAGTVVVEIDPKDYEVALEKARADLNTAVANLDLLMGK